MYFLTVAKIWNKVKQVGCKITTTTEGCKITSTAERT